MKIKRILRILTAGAALGFLPSLALQAEQQTSSSDSLHGTSLTQWGPRDFRQQRGMRPSDVSRETAPATDTQEVPEQTSSRRPSTTSSPSSSGQVVYEDHLVRVSKKRVDSGIVALGSEVSHEITVLAKQPVANVNLEEQFPNEIRYVSSEPSGQESGSSVNWDLGTIEEGDSKTVRVTSSPQERGTFYVCSVVKADPMICLPISVGEPQLEIAKSGPPQVELGETADWSITVTNTGDAIARDVRIDDEVPGSFTPGTEVGFEVGDLAPGESHDVTVGASAGEVGSFENIATATFAGGEPVQATAPIRVVESKLAIEKTGPERSYALLNERFKITVSNPGDTDLTDVQVVDRLPEYVRVDDAGGGNLRSGANNQSGTITWNVGNLASGESRSFDIVMTSTRPGTTVNNAIATSSGGLQEEANQTTEWIAVPAVQTSIVDDVDPIRVNQKVTYTLRVWNQSKLQPIEDASVKVTFPKEIRPLTAKTGSLSSDIEGNTVNVTNIDLQPGEDIIFTIDAEGAETGYGTVIMETSTGFRDSAVIDQESTTVY